MKELKVLKPFIYAGSLRKKGERIRTSNRHAGALIAVGKVTEVKHDETPRPQTRNMTSNSRTQNRNGPKRGRQPNRQKPYTRADMRSEDYERSDMAGDQ